MRRRILPYMDDIVKTMEIQWETPHADVRKKLAQLIFCSADVLQDRIILFYIPFKIKYSMFMYKATSGAGSIPAVCDY